MNRLSIIGNLTRDVELSQTASGISVARFSVAVNRRYTNSDGDHVTDYFNVSAWRGLGENAAKFLKKGSKVYISGPIQFDRFKDKNDVVHFTAQVTAEEIEFLSSNQQSTNTAATVSESATVQPVLTEIDDGDILF